MKYLSFYFFISIVQYGTIISNPIELGQSYAISLFYQIYKKIYISIEVEA